MKKVMKIALMAVLSVLLLSTSVVTSMADTQPAGVATVNGQQIEVGETITYTFNISDTEQKVTGMQMNIFFDQDALELLEVTDGVLNGSSTINDNQSGDGRIVLVNAFMNGGGLECKDKTALATATFKVTAAVETEITYFVQYLYDIDMVDIYSYTFTCDLTSGDAVISEDKTPILADGSLTDQITEVDNFRNNQEGKGDGVKREPQTVSGGQSQGGSSTGTAQPTTTAVSGDSNGGGNTGVIIAVIGTAIVAVAVAGVVIFKLKAQKDETAQSE